MRSVVLGCTGFLMPIVEIRTRIASCEQGPIALRRNDEVAYDSHCSVFSFRSSLLSTILPEPWSPKLRMGSKTVLNMKDLEDQQLDASEKTISSQSPRARRFGLVAVLVGLAFYACFKTASFSYGSQHPQELQSHWALNAFGLDGELKTDKIESLFL